MGATARKLPAIGVVAALWLSLMLVAGQAAEAAAVAEPRAPVTITVGKPSTRLPRSFFGLSVEYPELPTYERFLPAFEHILGLLKVAGDGPQVLRVGGDSADLTYWKPGTTKLPRGAYVLSSQWFTQLATLIADSRLRVLLDLNLRHGTATRARALAQAARSRLPLGSIIGLEVGNEPDQYGHGYSPAAYRSAFNAYAHSLRQVAPHMPLLGPAVTSTDNNFNWLQAMLSGGRGELGVLDGHQYPLAACEGPGDPGYPTVAKILSPSLTAGLAASVRPAVRLAHRAHVPFRLDETNSVTCGGKAGVSNTFATALWAPDALFSLLQTGLDAVNVHIRPTKINGPLAVDQSGFVARPLFYGLLLFSQTMSPGGRLLHVIRSSPPSAHLSVWAVRVAGNAIHVLLINKGASSVTVRLRLPTSPTATVERLSASSSHATGGVTLGGQRLGSDGQLKGVAKVQLVSATGGRYRLVVPGASAALVKAP